MTPNRYPLNWPEIAQTIKDEADWKCIRCGHPHDKETWHILTVHHLDGNKANCEWWNLVALCQKCHLSIQGRVIMERPWMFEHTEWFRPYVAGYYASVHGKSTDRAYVMENLNALLELGKPKLEDAP